MMKGQEHHPAEQHQAIQEVDESFTMEFQKVQAAPV
jgi:hypothetical protein